MPVLLRRQLDLLHVVPSVRRRLVVLAARLAPLDGSPEPHAAEDGDEVGGVGGDLAAKPAAYLRRDHPDLVFAQPAHERRQEPHDVRILRRVPERQLPGGRGVAGQRRSRLHRVRDQPLLNDAVRHHDLGVLEGGVDVATRHHPVERLVARDLLMQLRGARLRRGLRVGHRRQRLVIDLDQLERVLGGVSVLGHDHRDDVADVAHHVLGDAVIGGDLQVRVGEQPGAGGRLDRAVRVGVGVDGDHPGRRRRRARVDRPDPGVGVRAPEHGGVHHAGQRQVVGVGRRAGDEPRVLPAADA